MEWIEKESSMPSLYNAGSYLGIQWEIPNRTTKIQCLNYVHFQALTRRLSNASHTHLPLEGTATVMVEQARD